MSAVVPDMKSIQWRRSNSWAVPWPTWNGNQNDRWQLKTRSGDPGLKNLRTRRPAVLSTSSYRAPGVGNSFINAPTIPKVHSFRPALLAMWLSMSVPHVLLPIEAYGIFSFLVPRDYPILALDGLMHILFKYANISSPYSLLLKNYRVENNEVVFHSAWSYKYVHLKPLCDWQMRNLQPVRFQNVSHCCLHQSW